MTCSPFVFERLSAGITREMLAAASGLVRLRKALKSLLRSYRLRCQCVEEIAEPLPASERRRIT